MTDTEQLMRIENKIDALDRRVNSLHVTVEHRVTKLEGRASLFGILGGLLAAFAAFIIRTL